MSSANAIRRTPYRIAIHRLIIRIMPQICAAVSSTRMIEPIRLLAFAFAGADLLFEIDRDGAILFVTGAVSGFSISTSLTGRPAAELFSAEEQARFMIMAHGMM